MYETPYDSISLSLSLSLCTRQRMPYGIAYIAFIAFMPAKSPDLTYAKSRKKKKKKEKHRPYVC